MLVEPTLARLALCSDWRIFQALSVPQIIDKVLGQHRIFDRKLITTATYSPREYCVQAGETDLQILARLAAEEGLLSNGPQDLPEPPPPSSLVCLADKLPFADFMNGGTRFAAA
ncbi:MULTISPECIES: contractile injection system protein, VgrG/Pvc8 family [Pseudomonas]|uniref:contractile injection system protein, VgrG/Pvc8 family n=1 Tax=Pseudomonas TaxID=286 RepID=UPI00211542A0|nr:contractile injection system protein, VgrG/Pvc8 family [Pseudomonas sp. MYb187]